MSKGEIIEHKGEGLYRVRQKLAVERIQQELAQVQARLAELAVELPTAKLDLIHADDAVRDKAQEIDALIPDYAAGTEGALQTITTLQTELIRLQSEASQLRLKVAELIAEDLANRKRQNQLEQVPEGREMDLWCADYSVELTGEVGLVDINDEGGQGALVQPGFENGSAYNASRDGSLFPNLAQSGAQIYFNAAVLPGVQKWRPRYRVGTISNIVNDSCAVTLDDAESSAQGLNINEERILTGVPIQYMDCNGVVFESGDRVLVRFTQSGPLVVGFYEEPRPCILPGFLFSPASYTEGGSVTRYGQPITEENAPLGTAGGERPGWILHPDPDNYPYLKLKGRSMTNSGQANWAGANDMHLSWQGTGNRAAIWGTYGKEVFFRLRSAFNLEEHEGFEGDTVIGAGYDGAYLHVMSYSHSVTVFGGTLTHHRVPVDSDIRATGDRVTVQQITLDNNQRLATGCYWSANGQNAVITIVRDDQYYSWELSISSGGSHTFSELYDAVAVSDGAITSWTSNVLSVSERLIPIYVDYAGNERVVASWREPGLNVTASGSRTADSFEDNITVDTEESYQCTSRGAIVLDSGEVLAENEFITSWTRDILWKKTETQPYTYQVDLQGTREGRDNFTDLGYIHDAVLFVDARNKTAILGETYDTWDMAWDITDDYQGPFSNVWNGPSYPAGTQTMTIDRYGLRDYLRWRVSAWANGLKVAEFVDVSPQTFTPTVSQREPAVLLPAFYGPLDAPVGGNPYGNFEEFGGPLQIGSATFGSDAGLSLLHRRYDETVTGLCWISNVSDPATDLFGQSPGDPFFFDELTLV